MAMNVKPGFFNNIARHNAGLARSYAFFISKRGMAKDQFAMTHSMTTFENQANCQVSLTLRKQQFDVSTERRASAVKY